MRICVASNASGFCGVSFEYSLSTLESWFEVFIVVNGYYNGEKLIKGHYKKYKFKTLKAAGNKFDKLCEKHGIH